MIVAQVSDIHASPTNDNMLRLARALSWFADLKPDALQILHFTRDVCLEPSAGRKAAPA
ncbi:hypothetical protein C8K44_105101 [Aminobacter sp. AP02]|nr:hypothetical protein C8K44_105101 [Aminobacter sp. AP02]